MYAESEAKPTVDPSENPGKVSPWRFVPSLYFLQGIPNVIATTVSVAFYKNMGVPNDQIGVLTSLVGIPWIVKPFWGPLVDNNSTKRSWILVTQFLIAIALGIAAASTSLPAFLAVTLVLFFIVAFLSATHDIAADGFYILSLGSKTQAAFVGMRSLFFRLAMVFGTGFIVWYAGKMQKVMPADQAWQIALGVGAGVYAAVWLYNTWALPKPHTDPQHPTRAMSIIGAFAQVLLLVLGLILFGRWLVIGAAWLNETLVASGFGKVVVTPSANLTPLFLPAEDTQLSADRAANYISQTLTPFATQTLASLALIAAAAASTASFFKRIGMGPAAREYFTQERIAAVLAFILFYRFGESMISKMSQPFLLDGTDKGGLAVTTEAVGVLWGTLGVAALAIGGILGGWVIYKFGMKRSLWPMVLSLNIPNLFYLWLSVTRPVSELSKRIADGSLPFWKVEFEGSGPLHGVMEFIAKIPAQIYNLGVLMFNGIQDPVGQVVIVDQLGYGFGFAAYMVYLMFISQGAKFPTSHYAISTGLMALGATIAGAVSGELQQALGWQNFFLAVMLLTVPGMLTLFFIPMKGEDIRKAAAVD